MHDLLMYIMSNIHCSKLLNKKDIAEYLLRAFICVEREKPFRIMVVRFRNTLRVYATPHAIEVEAARLKYSADCFKSGFHV